MSCLEGWPTSCHVAGCLGKMGEPIFNKKHGLWISSRDPWLLDLSFGVHFVVGSLKWPQCFPLLFVQPLQKIFLQRPRRLANNIDANSLLFVAVVPLALRCFHFIHNFVVLCMIFLSRMSPRKLKRKRQRGFTEKTHRVSRASGGFLQYIPRKEKCGARKAA